MNWNNELYKVQDNTFPSWTEAQDYALELLNDGVKYVRVMLWMESHNNWGLLQELNLERGIIPQPYFNTWTLAPYYVKLRNHT